MALSSMTGFARSHGASGPYGFEWELKSVNAKGFDLRRRDGVTPVQIMSLRMDEIERLARKADAAPGRKPEAIRARLAEQVAALLESSDRFDPDRLNQEALLIAAKADIREELDRIASHIAQAREMIVKGRPIRPRLHFLATAFNPR